MWFNNDKIMVLFDMLNKGRIHFPCACPVCNKMTAHIYIHRHYDRHSGIWTWCSSCGSYSHMSGDAPKWWRNADFVDANQLCAEPEYLESMSDKIDSWVSSIIPDENLDDKKPLIMENKFRVKLLVDYQELSAGTVGTLLIKDDFTKITIDFINADGKTVNVKIQPDKVTSVFEVIK